MLGPAAQRFGWDRKNGEEEAVSLLRPVLFDWMADEGRDDAALTRAEQLAQSFRADRGSIDPSLVNVVLRLSAIRGKADLYDEYQKRFEQATAPTDRDPLLEAMKLPRPGAPRSRPRLLAGADGAASGSLHGPPGRRDRPRESARSCRLGEKNHKAILDKIPPVYAPFVVYHGPRREQPRSIARIPSTRLPSTRRPEWMWS